MKVLLTADIHYNRFWFEWLIAQAPALDLIAIAGDLVMGFSAEVLTDQKCAIEHWLGQITAAGCAVAVSSGNHEVHSKISPRVVEKKLTVGRILGFLSPSPSLAACHPLFLEDERTGIIESASGNLIVSTIPYKKFGDPTETSAASPMWDEARTLKRQTGFPWLVLHHDPPAGGPVGGMAGDFPLRQTIKEFQPDYVLSGHLHGQPFFEGGGFHERISVSHSFNAGQTPPTKSRVPNYIILNTDKRLATWFYFDLAAGLFKQESRFLA
ncbi:MAG: metallophosphoesterase [Verrucomicrobiae bacterium]